MPGSSFLPWIKQFLEGLWLLAVFLVPLVFLGQKTAISETQIAYAEIPKVALLRTLAGLIALLWLSEWAITSQALRGYFPSMTIPQKLGMSKAIFAVIRWLNVQPKRWGLLAVGLFIGSTFFSTILSGSITNSMWGEIPGQDGYSAYTVACYAVLFGVIATHVKTQPQMTRLVGTIVVMGALVGFYGIFQYFGHDFLGLTEITGGGSARVTVFMGNTIFAAAVLCMTIPMTLVAAALHFHNENWGHSGPLAKVRQLHKDYLLTVLWASILAVQLLGLIFTFSRGSWGAVALALVVFLSLLVHSLGSRILVRTGLVLGLATLFSIAFLHWQGSISIINAGEWLSFVLGLFGLTSTLTVLLIIKKYRSSIVIIAAAAAIVAVIGVATLAPYALAGRDNVSPNITNSISGPTAGQIAGRMESIKTDVLRGFEGGRNTHWNVSWKLIKDRPWFQSDELPFSWIRPLIGYGPDLFRYTYVLESPPEAFDLLPLEPDHAHNFFIHQTVEQGIIGGLASLTLFGSVLGVTGHLILFRRKTVIPVYRLVVIGLMAIVLGRLLEMMVGVARISDLTVLWGILGLFAAAVHFDNGHKDKADSIADQFPEPGGRRKQHKVKSAAETRSSNTGLILRIAIVAF